MSKIKLPTLLLVFSIVCKNSAILIETFNTLVALKQQSDAKKSLLGKNTQRVTTKNTIVVKYRQTLKKKEHVTKKFNRMEENRIPNFRIL